MKLRETKRIGDGVCTKQSKNIARQGQRDVRRSSNAFDKAEHTSTHSMGSIVA